MGNDLALEIRTFVAGRALCGYDTDAEILAAARESYQNEHPDLPGHEELVDRITLETLDELARAQREWPLVTDCDRLDRAFRALDAAGVVARQHFMCCAACGGAAMRDEVYEAGGPANVHGFTFFNTQRTERAVEGYPLGLTYGPVLTSKPSEEEYRRATVALGKEIARALRREGLSVDWDGTYENGIDIKMAWRRRRRRR